MLNQLKIKQCGVFLEVEKVFLHFSQNKTSCVFATFEFKNFRENCRYLFSPIYKNKSMTMKVGMFSFNLLAINIKSFLRNPLTLSNFSIWRCSLKKMKNEKKNFNGKICLKIQKLKPNFCIQFFNNRP